VDDARPRHETIDALVESPLQLLSAIEAHAAGLGGTPTRVQVRSDVPALARTLDALAAAGLPEDLVTSLRAPRAALSPFCAPDRMVGDAFSGLFQASLLTRRTRSLVVVDDGLATLHLARLLVDGGTLLRAGVAASPRRVRLAGLAARRLARLAAHDRLTLFTALPVADALAADLAVRGVRLERNRFAWLRGRTVAEPPAEPTVVVGSALAANGLVAPEPYLAWVIGHAARGPLRYIPHRRSDPDVLRALAETPGITVDESVVPIELRLAGMRAGQQVLSLPSTAAVLLASILTPRGVSVEAFAVPDDWWADQVSGARRAYLQSAVPLVAAARAEAERER